MPLSNSGYQPKNWKADSVTTQLFGRQTVERGPCHKPHAATRQAVHEGRQFRRGRVEARKRFHDAKESIVDQFFCLGLAASVALQLETDGLADFAGDMKEDTLAHIPEGGGIGGNGLRGTAGRVNLSQDWTPVWSSPGPGV